MPKAPCSVREALRNVQRGGGSESEPPDWKQLVPTVLVHIDGVDGAARPRRGLVLLRACGGEVYQPVVDQRVRHRAMRVDSVRVHAVHDVGVAGVLGGAASGPDMHETSL